MELCTDFRNGLTRFLHMHIISWDGGRKMRRERKARNEAGRFTPVQKA